MDWIKLGKKIKESRERKGLLQKDLGLLLGVSEQLICQLENGRKKTSVDNLVKLSKVLDLKIFT